jgi:hypothetical protein
MRFVSLFNPPWANQVSVSAVISDDGYQEVPRSFRRAAQACEDLTGTSINSTPTSVEVKEIAEDRLQKLDIEVTIGGLRDGVAGSQQTSESQLRLASHPSRSTPSAKPYHPLFQGWRFSVLGHRRRGLGAGRSRTGGGWKTGDFTQNRVNERNRDFATVKVWRGFALPLLAITAHQDVTAFTDKQRSGRFS